MCFISQYLAEVGISLRIEMILLRVLFSSLAISSCSVAATAVVAAPQAAQIKCYLRTGPANLFSTVGVFVFANLCSFSFIDASAPSSAIN
jgi:hypothetical protein